MNGSETKAPDLLEVYLNIQQRFREAGWEEFFNPCAGYHDEVAKAFVEGFDGQQVIVGGITFQVTEDMIAEVTGFPTDGERAFNSHVLSGVDVPFFLKDEFKEMNWRSRVQRSWLKDD